MRIVFMGTPGMAATILENLVAHHDVAAVFTRPDSVRGRGKKALPSPVKHVALSEGIAVFSPPSMRDDEVLRRLEALEPECICVAAYGALLPAEVLNLPRFGCLNVHASLLPRWRGAAPVERAILAQDEQTGVCIMRMEEGLDTGDYCIVRTCEIGEKNTTELTAELAELGSSALLTALAQIEAGSVEWTRQDPFFATYAEKIAKREFFVGVGDSAQQAVLKVRASSVAHPAKCQIAGRGVTLLKVRRVASRLMREELGLGVGQGRIFEKGLYLGLPDQAIEVLQLRPDGKRTMSGAEFAAGVQGSAGGFGWQGIDA